MDLESSLDGSPVPPPSPTVLLARPSFSNGSHTPGGAVNGTNGHSHDSDLEFSTPGGRPMLRRMASIKKEPYFANLRQQLQEQLRSLDSRVDTQALLTSELQEYFRRRAEVELEYSRGMDKLSKGLLARQKEVKQKREQVSLFSVHGCWSQLITETKKQAQEHGALSDIYSGYVTSRFSFVIDDLQRVYRKCREIGSEAHEELLHVLHEFHTSTKTWHTYQAEAKVAEGKLRTAEGQKARLLELIPPQKQAKSKKIRLADKEIEKKGGKYAEARGKALKAKNEYLLCMDAANSAVQKYFVDDLSDLIDCMDLGFYQCITRILNSYINTQQQIQSSIGQNVDSLNKCVSNLDSRLDKQRFLEVNNSAFVMPKKLEFVGPTLKGEEAPDTTEPGELSVAGYARQELEQRLVQLHHRLGTLRTESDELWKTLETAESTLLEMLTLGADAGAYDIRQCLAASAAGAEGDGGGKGGARPAGHPESMQVLKWRADRHETDEFHLDKFHEYMLSTNRIARLQAKYDHIRRVLQEEEGLSGGGAGGVGGAPSILVQALHPSPYSSCASQGSSVGGDRPAGPSTGLLAPGAPGRRRKRIGAQLHAHKKPKLFGGSLEEYIECTGQEIPTILSSCIRIINLYGLHHQGLFRVSGSQVEINHFRDAFEQGEDPLTEATDASDINSIAGVFKLYLRELREPLFPIVYFEQFMELAQLESKHSLVMRMRELVASLPRTVFVVLRYLFAFLNHLSEFSDENMMDPYNIAICFGPTLVPVPEDKDQIAKLAGSRPRSLTASDSVDLQVQYQNLVNELIKNLIIFAEEIFPNDGIGAVYEKYLSRDPGTGGQASAPSSAPEGGSEDAELDTSSAVLSEDDESDSSVIEAVAQYNFNARSPRELSFAKGDCIRIYSQVSSDWWRGSVNGVAGLVPDKYITIVKSRGLGAGAGLGPQGASSRGDKRSAGLGPGGAAVGTTSDSCLAVAGGPLALAGEPSTSSKSTPLCYASETHPASRSHHHGGAAAAGLGHHKSSSVGGSAAIFGGGGPDSESASNTSIEVVPSTSRSGSKPEKVGSLTKEDLLDAEDDEGGAEEDVEEASISSNGSRSHSLSISMPKSVENEAAPTTSSQALSGSLTLLSIREDDGDGEQAEGDQDNETDQNFAQSSQSQTRTGAPTHNRAVQQHSPSEAAYANMETYWEAMKQCKKPLPPQYVKAQPHAVRNGSTGGHGSHPDLVMDLPLPQGATPAVPGSSAMLPPPAAYACTSVPPLPRSTSTGSSDGDGDASSDDSSSNASSPTGSPDGAGPAPRSAADCFAKQNQCTLKKGAWNPVGPSAVAAAAGGAAGRPLGGAIQENPFMRQNAPPAAPKPQVKVKPVLKSSFLAASNPIAGHGGASSTATATAEFESLLMAREKGAAGKGAGGKI